MKKQIRTLPKNQAALILFICLPFCAQHRDNMAQSMKAPSSSFPASNRQFALPDRPYRFMRNPGSAEAFKVSSSWNKFQTTGQSESTVTETISQKWFIDHWVNESRQLYTYDDQSRNTVNVFQSWTAGRWNNQQRNSDRYDEQGMRVEWKVEKWNGAGWIMDSVENCVYTPDNRLEFSSHHSLTENGTNPVSDWKSYYTYDDRGRQTAILDSSWDENRQQWRLRTSTTTQYDSLDRPVESIRKYIREDTDMASGYMEFIMKTVHTYDDGNRTNESVEYNWDPYLSVWTPYMKSTNYYNEQNVFDESLSEVWFNNSWIPSYRFESSFDAATFSYVYINESYENGVLTLKEKMTSIEIDSTYGGSPGKAWVNTTERWDDGQWLFADKNISWYDPENLSSGFLSQRWADGSWWNVSRTMVNVNRLADPEMLPESCTIANYPNPFNSSTTILFKISGTLDIRLMVVDIRGRLVAELKKGTFGEGVYETIWTGTDASGRPVPNGVYIAVMTSGDSRATRKILLAK